MYGLGLGLLALSALLAVGWSWIWAIFDPPERVGIAVGVTVAVLFCAGTVMAIGGIA
jgi:hypothetical protein